MIEPAAKRVYAFVDGQNLYNHARAAFGCRYPDFDPQELCRAICKLQAGAGWNLSEVHFYTGIHDPLVNAFWNGFWSRKLQVMQTRGVRVFSRPLRYVKRPDGTMEGQEKGIDVRIALDAIRFAMEGAYDVALVLSQDQDLNEVATEIRRVSQLQQRWIKVASAFPASPTASFKRGIDKTDWIPFDQDLYNACIDPLDYRGPLARQS